MAEKLELALLGTPELQRAGQPLGKFRSAKVYALLYYLAVTRRTQPRSVLAGLFWGDIDEYYARRNFNRTLSDLAQFVADQLVIERQSVAFARSQPYWLDVEELENAAAAQPTLHNVAALASAADLYRSDFLDGFYVQDAPEFEQWVLAERTRLRTSALQLLHNLAQFYTEQGELRQAIAYARRLLQVEPWREEAHRQLMLLLAQSGQRSAALAQYELCRQVLHSELNVEPDATTLELVARIRAGGFDKVTRLRPEAQPEEPQGGTVKSSTVKSDTMAELVEVTVSPPPPVTVPPPETVAHNLPGQRTPFIGREAELADIMRLLVADDDCRLLSLIGPGGMGKTRLAIKAAEQIVAIPFKEQRFRDGIFFVPLENVSDADGLISAVISAISEERGFPLQTDAPLQEQLFHFLRTRVLLLVLDNFEHLVNQAVLLSELLATAPRVKLLVTARETLGLLEAWFYPVLGLTLPTGLAETTAQQDAYAAVRLFVQCARRTRPNFVLADERDAVLRICTLVEGMPLGIELAATWLKVMNCEQIAQEVARGLDILTARYQNMPARHRSMRVVMEHSWAMLATAESAAIARLAVFRGQFRQEAARAITGTSLFTLAMLVEKALVRVNTDGSYQLHELTRQYAAEQLTSPTKAALQDAHVTYYAGLLDQQKPQLFTGQYRQVLGMISGELDNIRHAWLWLIESVSTGRTEQPWPLLLRQMAEVLAHYYLFFALGLPGQVLFANASQAVKSAGWATAEAAVGDPLSRPATLVHLQLLTGLFYFELGHYGGSLAIAEGALEVCRALHLQNDLLLALLLYGRTQMRRGVHADAATTLHAAFALGQQLGSTHSSIEALIGLGMVASATGRYGEAQAYYKQALALCQELGYRPWVARTLTNLGSTFSRQLDYRQALPYHEQALAVAQEEGNQHMIMIITSNLASVQRGFERYQLSLDYYQRSLAMARKIGEKRWIAANLNGMALTYLAMGELTNTERVLREGLAVGQESESIRDTLGSIGSFGHLFARRGQLEKAIKVLTFVVQHPATMMHDRLTSQALFAELRSELAPVWFEQAQTWAAAQTLADVARWLLHGDSAFPKLV